MFDMGDLLPRAGEARDQPLNPTSTRKCEYCTVILMQSTAISKCVPWWIFAMTGMPMSLGDRLMLGRRHGCVGCSPPFSVVGIEDLRMAKR